jgi:hypothetical protein
MLFFDMPPSINYNEKYGDHLKTLNEARTKASEVNLAYQSMYKNQYDVKHKAKDLPFKVGDYVFADKCTIKK